MAKKGKGGDDAEGGKKSPKMKIIVGVVGLAAAWKLGVLPIGQPKEDANALGPTTTTAVVEGAVVPVGDDQVINLADDGTGVAHYARVSVALVLNEHPSDPDVEEHASEAHATEETHATEAPHVEEVAETAATVAVTETTAAPVTETTAAAADVEHAAEEGAHKGATQGKASSGGGGAEVDPAEAVADRFGSVQNMVLAELRTWTYAELMAPDAFAEVQERLSEQVQEIYEHDEVVRVVFTQFVIQ
jgi:flagellar basal body-associated protein FliL